MKYRLVHYLMRDLFLKSHLAFSDQEDIEHYFICPRNSPKNLIEQLKSDTLPGRVIMANGDTLSFNPRVLKQVLALKPDVVIFSDYKMTNSKLFMELRRHKIRLYIFNHGIWCPGILGRREQTGSKNSGNLQYFDKLFYTKNEISFIDSKKSVSSEIVPVNGFIGIDYVKSKPIKELNKKPSILLVTNKSGFNNKVLESKPRTVSEYKQILDVLLEFGIQYGYHIYSKMKPNKNLHNGSSSHSNLTVIQGNQLIYDYLVGCDIVIVQGYSTVYLESLVMGKPVILVQFPKGSDYLGLDQYPELLQANSKVQLHDQLLKLHNDLGVFPEVVVNKYLEKYLGLPFESVTEKIYETLRLDLAKTTSFSKV